MRTVLLFTVPGRPQPCQRARTVTNSRGETHAYTNSRTKEFEARVALFAQSASRIAGWQWHPRDTYSICLRVFRTDACHWNGGNRGDWDNFAKGVCDGLNGVLYRDDSGIVESAVSIRCDPKNPRVEVLLTKLTDGRLYQEHLPIRKKRQRRPPNLALSSKVDGARTVRSPKPPPTGG